MKSFFLRLAFLLILALSVSSCTAPLEEDTANEEDVGNNDDNIDDGGSGPDDDGPVSNEHAIWKRVASFQNDLARALALPKEAVCTELNSLDCFTEVHLAALGGNEPFEQAQYETIDEPSAITAVAVERVVLSACSNRVTADQAPNNNAEVFVHYDLGQNAQPNDASYLGQFDQQNIDLYRRILARDPSSDELSILRQLLDNPDPISNRDIAILSCYAIATTSEFIFL